MLALNAVGFRTVLTNIMATGFNTGMLILRALNEFPFTKVHTPFLKSLPFKQSPAWDLIQGLINQSA